MVAATRLRGGNAGSARGAARFAAEALSTARAAGCSGTLVARADSAFYSAGFTGAVRARGVLFGHCADEPTRPGAHLSGSWLWVWLRPLMLLR